jgi:hypothetical protein
MSMRREKSYWSIRGWVLGRRRGGLPTCGPYLIPRWSFVPKALRKRNVLKSPFWPAFVGPRLAVDMLRAQGYTRKLAVNETRRLRAEVRKGIGEEARREKVAHLCP